MNELDERYPRQISLKDGDASLDLLVDPSAQEIMDFAAALPSADLLFLNRNIQVPKVLDAWRESIAQGDIVSIVAKRGSKCWGRQRLCRIVCPGLHTSAK